MVHPKIKHFKMTLTLLDPQSHLSDLNGRTTFG